MASQFSKEGRYFAQISTQGKLKIWETSTSSLLQEFTPDFHLTTPCTCLQFVEPEGSANKSGSPRKKVKRRSSTGDGLNTSYITLGTTSGSLFAYSIAKGDLDFTVDSKTNHPITCMSWREGGLVFTGAEQDLVCWNLDKRTVKSKWKTGNEKITAVQALPTNAKVLTASKNIKLWDVAHKQVLKTFTGHSYEVSILQYVNPKENSGDYFISGSKGDRILSCWNLDENHTDPNSVVSFLMEDVVNSLSVTYGSDGSTNMAVTIRSGVVHIYQHTLNGKCPKPLKPRMTVQVASDTGQSKSVNPIPIFGAIFREDLSLLIGHGTSFIMTFENVVLNEHQKLQCLVRKDPRTLSKIRENKASKVKTPLVNDNVEYITPHTTSVTTKRKNQSSGQMEVPMEKRLENLTLKKPDGESIVPRGDNVAQLLVQGIHSKDKTILKSALSRRDPDVIRNSVKRLPMAVVEPLVNELTSYIQGKTALSQIGAHWLKIVLEVHASILLSRPDLPELLGPALGSIESRLTLQTPLNRLRGRLDMLISQVSGSSSENGIVNEEALLIVHDKDDSDSDGENMDMAPHSESDNEWVEESSEDEVNNGLDNDDSDVDMSS